MNEGRERITIRQTGLLSDPDEVFTIPQPLYSVGWVTIRLPFKTFLRKFVRGDITKENMRDYTIWRQGSYDPLQNICREYLLRKSMPTELSELTRRQRQSLATWLLGQAVYEKEEEEITPSDDHAEEVVEPETLTSEDVHGADDCAQDIEDAPEREDADGDESDQGEDGGEGEEGEKDDGEGDGGEEGDSEEGSAADENGEEDEEAGDGQAQDGESGAGEEDSTEDSSTCAAADLLSQLESFIGNATPEKRESIMDVSEEVIPLQKEIRALLEKLAFERAPYGHTDEQSRWDGKKLALGRFYPHHLPVAKSGREKDHEIYFMLDDSGSMYQHSQMFQSLLEASRHVVRLFVGSEGRPCEEVNGTFKAEYSHSFAKNLEIFLLHFRPAPGSVLLFWGDTCDMHIRGEELKVRALLRPYRAYWLGTYEKYDYYGWEQPSLPKAGFKVVAPVTSPLELRQAIKKIK